MRQWLLVGSRVRKRGPVRHAAPATPEAHFQGCCSFYLDIRATKYNVKDDPEPATRDVSRAEPDPAIAKATVLLTIGGLAEPCPLDGADARRMYVHNSSARLRASDTFAAMDISDLDSKLPNQ